MSALGDDLPQAQRPLSQAEQELVEAAHSGAVLDLTGRDDADRKIGSELIYDLCVNDDQVNPKGVRLDGAIIETALDFEAATLRLPLALAGCKIGEEGGDQTDKAVCLEQATCQLISLENCRIYGQVSAGGCRVVHALSLHKSVITGGIGLAGARIDRQLILRDVNLGGTEGISANGDSMVVGDSAFLDGDFSTTGAVRMVGAKIGGNLQMSGGKLGNSEGLSLIGDMLDVNGIAALDSDFEADGAIRLSGARIRSLSMTSAYISGADQSGTAVLADGMRVEAAAFLLGLRTEGAVYMTRSSIGHQLVLRNACLGASEAVSFSADGISVEGGAFLDGQFWATGGIRMVNGKIVDNLEMTHAILGADDGSSLMGHVTQRAAGDETVPLGVVLDTTGNSIGSASTPSLLIDNLDIGGNLFLDRIRAKGFVSMNGADVGRTTSAQGAMIFGVDPEQYAFKADNVAVDNEMLLVDGFTTPNGKVSLCRADLGRLNLAGCGPIAGLDLEDAHCSTYGDSREGWLAPGSVKLNGFSFDHLDDEGDVDRLDWVRRQGFEDWSPDPYKQVAAYYEQSGDDENARRVRIARNRDESEAIKVKAKSATGWAVASARWTRFWRALYDISLGFGYERWRAGLALTFVIALSVLVFWLLNAADVMVSNATVAAPAGDVADNTDARVGSNAGGAEEAPTQPSNETGAEGRSAASTAGVPCGDTYPCFNPIVYGADVVLPIIDFGQDSEWRPNSADGGWGTFGVWYRWTAIAAGWALASIFVAAFTSLIQRE